MLVPRALWRLARQLASTADADEAKQIMEQLTRGFYGSKPSHD
jgi:hypothetical protein